MKTQMASLCSKNSLTSFFENCKIYGHLISNKANKTSRSQLNKCHLNTCSVFRRQTGGKAYYIISLVTGDRNSRWLQFIENHNPEEMAFTLSSEVKWSMYLPLGFSENNPGGRTGFGISDENRLSSSVNLTQTNLPFPFFLFCLFFLIRFFYCEIIKPYSFKIHLQII